MPRDGSGNYQLPSGQPVVTNTPISSTVHNALAADVATALTNSLSKDGQTTPTANLPMGGNRHTNVSDGTARNQYPSIGQVQDGALHLVGSVSGVDSITGSLTPAISGYVNGMYAVFVPVGANTVAAPTLALNGLAAKTITKFANSLLNAGDLNGNVPAVLVYSSALSGWVLLNPVYSSGSALTDGSVTFAKLQAISTDRLLGRISASTGAVEQIPISDYVQTLLDDTDAATMRGSLGLGTLATQNGTFSGSHSGNSSGTNTGDQTNISGSAGSLNGFVQNSAPSTNTIVLRDGNGYVNAVYFNQNSPYEIMGISAFWFETAGDGYLRKITFANAMAQINPSVSIAASQVSSGTFADARIAATNVTQYQSSFKGRNISGKSGTSFTIQSGGTASGGSDGDLIGIY